VGELFGHGAQGFQTPVSAENVIFGIVGGEGLAAVGGALGRARRAFFKTLAAAGAEFVQLFSQECAIGGEVLIYEQGASQRHDRYQIGRRHLGIEVVLGRGYGVVDFIGFHSGEIEEKNDEAAVLVLICRSRGGLRPRRFSRSHAGQWLGLGHIERGNDIDIFHVERCDLLRFVVFEDGKVFRLQSEDEVSFLVAHGYVDEHKVRFRM
jgi:hypothetical protein